MTDPLSSPIRLIGLEVKKRIFMPPMHLKLCRDCQVSDRQVAVYTDRTPTGGARAALPLNLSGR